MINLRNPIKTSDFDLPTLTALPPFNNILENWPDDLETVKQITIITLTLILVIIGASFTPWLTTTLERLFW